MRPEGRIFLLTGIPGAGKTTVSRLLAARFERAVQIEADTLQELIVCGGLWPDQEPQDEALRQLALRAKNCGMLAANFYDQGFTVVIDDIIIGKDRLAIYQRHLGEREFSLIVLAPSLEIALERDAHREYKQVGDRWAHLDAEQRERLGDVGAWLDTGNLTAQETVEAILALER